MDSVIGYGAPTKAGTHSAHGEPLGADEIRGTKRDYGWPEDEQFLVPDAVRDALRRGPGRPRRPAAPEWDELFARYTAEYPELADQLDQMQRRQLPDGWDADIPDVPRRRQGCCPAGTPPARCSTPSPPACRG